jgi:ABC-type sulfate transport system permease component
MIWWLAGIAICCLIWASIWKKNIALAFGILLGVLLAWLLSYSVEPYVTGMESIPVWLPPLPLATVATLLFVYGAKIWLGGNDKLPQPKQDDDKHHH